MGKQKETGLQFFYRQIAPRVTSVGAAVVVIGALFKIMHWPGAGEMLTIGLSTEAALFFIGTFAPASPPEVHYHWENVYPELVGEAGTGAKPTVKKPDTTAVAALGSIDQWLAQANLSADTFKNFGQGMQNLNTTVGKMKDMSEAVLVTNEYTGNLKTATKSLVDLNKAYSGTLGVMTEMVNASKDTKAYHAQVQEVTKNLGALNAVYEMELKDANSHLKAMNKFYSNLTVAMESMTEASKESQVFKEQMVKLTGNLTSLNKIYGNMLTAMKG